MRWALLFTGAFALMAGVSTCSTQSQCDVGCDESAAGRGWADGPSAGAGGGAAGGAGGRESDIYEPPCGATARPLTPGSKDEVCTFDLGPLPANDGRYSYEAIGIFADGVPILRDREHSYGWDYADAAQMSIAL